MRSKFHFASILAISLCFSSCTTTVPTEKICTDDYLRPGYAYSGSEEDRFNQTKRLCEPKYQLDQVAFHKAYIQGENDQHISTQKSHCGCEAGYSTGYYQRDKRSFDLDEVQKDPFYKCDNSDGKSEFERGLSLGKKYGQYVEENKWSFKPIYHPDGAAIKKACMK